MATVKWLGQATAVKQVTTFTPGSVTIGNTFTLTCNSKTVTVTATAATVANVTGLLVAAASASTAPLEFADVDWTDSTTHVTATSKVAGRPFTITSSAATGAGSGTPTNVASTTTANSGPNVATVGANWSGGSAPSNNDTIVFEKSSVDLLYALDVALTGITLRVENTYTGRVGLPVMNSAGYAEYRPTYLAYGCGTVTYAGKGAYFKLDGGSTTTMTLATVNDTGNSSQAGLGSLQLKASTITALNVNKGSVDVNPFATDAATTLGTLKTGSDGTVSVYLGGTCTTTTVTMNGGSVTTNGAVSTVTINDSASRYTTLGSGTQGTVKNAGIFNHTTAGTITSYEGIGTGTLELANGQGSCTISTCVVNEGGTINDPGARATYSAGILLKQCRVGKVRLDVGLNRTLSIA